MTHIEQKREAARKKVMVAMAEYGKYLPKTRKGPRPHIQPVLKWAMPDSFGLGYNMSLDCWTAPATGKIPVLVVPLNDAPELMRYLRPSLPTPPQDPHE